MSEVNFPGSGRPPDPSASDSLWTRRFVLLALAILGARAIYAALFPLDLAPDESYYWDWGRRPDIGYFSKPPMIGWLMTLASTLGRDSMFALKFLPALLATVALGFVFLLGRDLFGARAGFWAAVVLLATPANAALNTFFTIDAPLFLFWSASLWFAWRWQTAPEGRSLPWAMALVTGLGLGYLTKQIQLVFPVLLLLFLAVSRHDARPPGRPRYLEALGIFAASLLFLIPPLLWNWRHDWITFRHTADELSDAPFRWLRSAKFVGEFLGGQAALGGGITFVLMMVATAAAVRGWRTADSRHRYLVLFFLPGWIAYAALAFRQRVEQNWALVFYTAAAVQLAGWVESAASGASHRRTSWRSAGVGLGAVLAAALMAVPFVLPATPWAGSRSDPTARIRGWRTLAEKIEPFRRGVARPDRTFLLAPDDRYVASALAHYLPDHPRTYCWEDPRHPESQYGIWGRPEDRGGWDALVIFRDERDPRVAEIRGRFDSWERLGEVGIALGRAGSAAARDRRYWIFLGRGFRALPGAEMPAKRGESG